MGGDGGVIAAKREYMQSCGDVFGMKGGIAKTALNRIETAELRSKVCAISNEKLEEPIAADELGYLFNKDTLLSGLLERNLDPAFGHIRGLKDVIDCRMTLNPAYAKEDRSLDGAEPSQFMCPVTLQELNGSHVFVVLKSTGWVMAEKAIKEVGINRLQEEYGPFTEHDIIKVAPTDEERDKTLKALLATREASKAAKKALKSSKKSKRREETLATEFAGGRGRDETKEGDAGEQSQHKAEKRRKRAEKSRNAASSAVGANGPDSSRLAGAAAQAVKKNKESSAVYASLFGKKEVTNENLFIATAAHRYNLG